MYFKGLLYTLIIRFNYRFGIFVARWGGVGGRMQRQKREVAASGSCEREEEEEDW